ncbi:CDP-glycerol glycerophosphotransferase family protein [Cobetia amphilecti]|uniref:capsular polysaccharide export protein, LipB/KpsS family n=1 Tax=Cobetia amphilecti TaxID=1055104 RepID=UPI00244A84D5|nr:CDP-glycerol glycerophosphotransferase family protein [Cobetia litoralis]MDH2421826.1 CDP-glycerol glycerophosphotransferase family protein [Cobetia litoralis]
MKNALIQSGDHFENQNRILPLALHLKASDIEPIILLYSENAAKLFTRYNLQVVYLDRFRKEVNSKPTSFPYDYEEVMFIERQRAYSRFNKPHKIKHEKFKIDRDYSALSKILSEFSPEYVFIWNGFTGNVANILRVITSKSENYKVWFLERSFYKNSLFVDSTGANAAASISRQYSHYENNIIPKHYVVDKLIDDYEVPDKNTLCKEDFIFVPLQVQTDTNNILYSPHIKKTRALVIATIRAVERINRSLGKQYKIIVRTHPEEVDPNINLPHHPLVLYRSSGAIKDWCYHASAVVNVNSTVGMEAIYIDKPVISFGHSLFSHEELTVMSDLPGFRNKLQAVLSGEIMTPKLDSKLSFFNHLYLYNTSNIENFPKSVSSILNLDPDIAKAPVPYSSLAKKLTNKEGLTVGCYLNYDTTLDLTYRKNKEEITPNLYRKLFEERYNYKGKIKFKLLNADRDNIDLDSFDLIIRDERHSSLEIKHDLILDEYLLEVNR